MERKFITRSQPTDGKELIHENIILQNFDLCSSPKYFTRFHLLHLLLDVRDYFCSLVASGRLLAYDSCSLGSSFIYSGFLKAALLKVKSYEM
jgi:hypothetical protein